ncbi:hypothetical protein UUU_11230 [Klebsiella pneumoniae subsp. pneumoniae DSM 30104 = JCM 1662 = NBRC 14940]|nr:hypothetical protein UUU_11230 [Klebsiella pneumoniae subsp. pneumoniae DSM 30104 = JCM 1662 = NBRC 14940]
MSTPAVTIHLRVCFRFTWRIEITAQRFRKNPRVRCKKSIKMTKAQIN